MSEYVVLVDEQNNEIGKMEKLLAHKNWGHLHRAFSIFLFNDKWELLIQQRYSWKYHCGWLWSNTVCSHQRVGEDTLEACVRRLEEELWISWYKKEDLKILWTEIYRAEFENGLTEHEYDFIVVWRYNWEVKMVPEEVVEHDWVSLSELKNDMKSNPEKYTPWFKIIIEKEYFKKLA